MSCEANHKNKQNQVRLERNPTNNSPKRRRGKIYEQYSLTKGPLPPPPPTPPYSNLEDSPTLEEWSVCDVIVKNNDSTDGNDFYAITHDSSHNQDSLNCKEERESQKEEGSQIGENQKLPEKHQQNAASPIENAVVEPSVQVDEYIQINRTEKSLKRPTSLFKPGEPIIFFDSYTANQNFGAMEKLAQRHYDSQNITSRSMTSQTRRKRRPLPPIPKTEEVMKRDVGVMTPDVSRINYCGSPVSPQAPSTYNSSLDEDWVSNKTMKNKKIFGRKTKLCLLLVPSLVAIVTTILFVLLLMGEIGTSNNHDTLHPNISNTPTITYVPTIKTTTTANDHKSTRPTGQQQTTIVTSQQDKTTSKSNRIKDKEQKRKKAKKTERREVFTTAKFAAITKLQSNRNATQTSTNISRKRKNRRKGKRRHQQNNKKAQSDNRKTRHLGRSILVPKYDRTMMSQSQDNQYDDDNSRITKSRDEISRNFDKTSSIKWVGRLTKGANNDVIKTANYDVISGSRSNVNRLNEYGSAYLDQDFNDDEYTDDVTYTNNDVIDTTEDEGQLCDVITDPVCDAVLPYKYTTPLTSSNMTSFHSIVQTLRERSKQRDDCDVESLARFVCASLYPQCTGGAEGVMRKKVVCQSWCFQIIRQCFQQNNHENFKRAKLVQEQAREKRHHVTNQPITAENQLDTSFCEHFDGNDVTCLDISRMNEFVEAPTAQGCGAGYFSCVNEQCIDNQWLCDGNNDCEGGEDEADCVSTCEFGEFRCDSGQCVEQRRYCDGIEDCMDRSDERNCGECGESMTPCGSNGQCVLTAWWCDGDVDCAHGEDETNCTCASQGLHSCKNEEKCFADEYICDGENDCADGWDEMGCQPNDDCRTWEFQCSGRCLPITKRCDGIVHCLHGEDENGCGGCEDIELNSCAQMDYNVTMLPNYLGHVTQSSIALSPEYVTITTMTYMRCHAMTKQLGCLLLAPPIGNHQSCDTLPRQQRPRLLPCRSFCEEIRSSCSLPLLSASLAWPRFLQCENFPKKEKGKNSCFDLPSQDDCPTDKFRCTTTSRDQLSCIAASMRCDGTRHCADGSDELDCDCKALGRSECGTSGKCILSGWVCDSHSDCKDGSDETDCDKCQADELACGDFSCIKRLHWCDGVRHCKDGSDETNCVKLVPRGKLYAINRHSSPAHQRGILVAYHSNTSAWRPVCAERWQAIFSHLACDQMGFSEAITSTRLPQRQPYNFTPLKISGTKRIRRIQELFQHKSSKCSTNTILHIGCKAKQCGEQPANHVSTRILGGRTSRQNTWPWLASLSLPGMKHVCGATLVRQQWLLSAAHCFQERKDVRLWKVELKGDKIEVFNATQILTHPRYDEMAVDFDIALIKLDRRVGRKSTHSPICLPSSTFDPGSYCIIAGWGVTGKTLRVSSKLQQGSVHVIKRNNCQKFYPKHVITERMVCAGHSGLVDACSGDSGGALMCWQAEQLRWQVAGVTSWGSSCLPHSAPGVYTNVWYFAGWIEQIVDMF